MQASSQRHWVLTTLEPTVIIAQTQRLEICVETALLLVELPLGLGTPVLLVPAST